MNGIFRLITMEIPWPDVLKGLNQTVTTAKPVQVIVNATQECPYGFVKAVANRTYTQFSNGTKRVLVEMSALCKPRPSMEPDYNGGSGRGNMTGVNDNDQVG